MNEYWIHLLNEKKILDAFVKRNRKEHKSSMILKKLQHLKKVTSRFCNTSIAKDREIVLVTCMELYVLATSNFALKHYIVYSYIILGLSARIFYLVGRINCEVKNEIDDIFG